MKETVKEYFKKSQLLGVIVGAILSLIIHEFTYRRIKVTELKLESRKEIFLSQRTTINKIKELISLSSSTIFYYTPAPIEFKFDIFELPDNFSINDSIFKAVVYNGKQISFNCKNPDFFYNDANSNLGSIFYFYPNKNKRIPINILRIVKNKAMQKQWTNLVSQIEQERFNLDRSLFQSIEELVRFLKWHPFPASEKAGDVIQSKWNDEDQINKWEELNSKLKVKVNITETYWKNI